MTKNTITVDHGKFEMLPHWLLFETNISPLALRLYLVLRKYGNTENKCFPSRQRLATDLGVSKVTIDRTKKELIEAGAVCEKHRMGAENTYTSNLYHIHWEQDHNCQSVITSDEGSDTDVTRGSLKFDTRGSLTDDDLTNTHLELRPNINITSDVADEHKQLAPVIDSQAQQLAQHFCNQLHTNGITLAKVTPKWITELDRMNRIDGRSWEQIEACIQWATSDAFWSGVILSPTKLRKHYDQMNVQARKQNTTPTNIYSRLADMYQEQEQNELN
jgi:hypothetical protein